MASSVELEPRTWSQAGHVCPPPRITNLALLVLLVAFAQDVIVNRALNWTLPITGGSGQYGRARGQVVSRDVSTPTQPQVELTFQLED